jgi:hypothetical protein
MDILKIFRKYDVSDMPVILVDDKLKTIICSASFKNLNMIKIGRFVMNYNYNYISTLI